MTYHGDVVSNDVIYLMSKDVFTIMEQLCKSFFGSRSKHEFEVQKTKVGSDWPSPPAL